MYRRPLHEDHQGLNEMSGIKMLRTVLAKVGTNQYNQNFIITNCYCITEWKNSKDGQNKLHS